MEIFTGEKLTTVLLVASEKASAQNRKNKKIEAVLEGGDHKL
jgi:hypothetical protein